MRPRKHSMMTPKHDQEGIPGAEDEPYVEDGEQHSEGAPAELSIQSESIEYLEERPEDHVEDQPGEQKPDEDQPAADEPAFTTHDEYEDDADGDYEDYGEALEDGRMLLRIQSRKPYRAWSHLVPSKLHCRLKVRTKKI